MATTKVEKVGRRHYLRGLPYQQRYAAKDAGCRWDPQERAWWSGKRDVAERVLAAVADAPQESANDGGGDRAPRDGRDSVVAGRAKYKGRTYYVAGRKVRGRTHWDDGVEPVTSRDGRKVLLYFRDGSRQFWATLWEPTYGQRVRVAEIGAQRAPHDQAEIVKSYDRPRTIRGLAEFAARRRAEDRGEAECPVCARHCTCGQGGLCHHHHDGCDRCGAER